MNKDNFNRDKTVLLYAPELVAPTIDVDSAVVSLAGFESVTFYVAVGSSGDTLSGSLWLDATIEESATSGGSYTAAAAADIISSDATVVNTFAVVDAPADIDTVYALGYKGSLGFAKVAIDVTGTMTNGIVLAIWCVLSNATLQSTNQEVQSS